MKNQKLNKLNLLMLTLLLGIAGVNSTSKLLAEEQNTEDQKGRKSKKKNKNKKEKNRKNKNKDKNKNKEINQELRNLKQQRKDLKRQLKEMDQHEKDKEGSDKRKTVVSQNNLETLTLAHKSLKYVNSDEALALMKNLKRVKNSITNITHKEQYMTLEEKINHMVEKGNEEKAEELRNAQLELVRLRTMKHSILYHLRNASLKLNDDQFTAGEKYTSKDIKTMIKVGLKKTVFNPEEVTMKKRDEQQEIDVSAEFASLSKQIRNKLNLDDKEDITFKHALTFVKKHLTPEIKSLVSTYVSRKAARKMDQEGEQSEEEAVIVQEGAK